MGFQANDPWLGREPTSRTAHADLLQNDEAFSTHEEYFSNVRLHQGGDRSVAQEALSRFRPYASALTPELMAGLPPEVVGLDSSPYEGALYKDDPTSPIFPSSRVGIIHMAQVTLDFHRARAFAAYTSRGGQVDPRAVQGMSQTQKWGFWFCSSGMTPKGAATGTDGFRTALCDALRKPSARLPAAPVNESPHHITRGWSLMGVFHHWLRRMAQAHQASPRVAQASRYQVRAGTPGIWKPRCSLCGTTFPAPIQLLPDRVGAVRCPTCEQALTEMDVLSFIQDFSEEHPNLGLFTRLESVLEHLRAFQVLLASTTIAPPAPAEPVPPTSSAPPCVLWDGPLALFSGDQVFAQALRGLTQDIHEQHDRQAVMFGVIKTGQLMDFIQAVERLNPIPNGSFWVVGPQDRHDWVAPSPRRGEHGQETHFAHDVVVKTVAGQLFVVSVPFPWSECPAGKDPAGDPTWAPFVRARGQDPAQRVVRSSDPPPHLEKLRLGPLPPASHTYLMRVLGVLEVVQAHLFGGSTMPQLWAHGHASLSQHPSGDLLVQSIRELIERQGHSRG